MDGNREQSYRSHMRVLNHIRKLDDCFGQFRIQVTCRACHKTREFTNEEMVRLARSKTASFAELADRLVCTVCQLKQSEIVAVPEPRPRGVNKHPR